MPIDAHSTCPGGTGKKIKFCCTDLLTELQKIERMLEGGQFQACLGHINRLEEKRPGPGMPLRHQSGDPARNSSSGTRQRPTPRPFLKHTRRTRSLWRNSLGHGRHRGRSCGPGTAPRRRLAASSKELEHRVYETVGLVAHQLALEGNYLAARACSGSRAASTELMSGPLPRRWISTRLETCRFLVKDFKKM